MECMQMTQRRRWGFTIAEKAELWDRWQRGESLKFTREIKKCFCKRADRYISVAQIKVATQRIGVSQENKCELLLRNLYI